MHTMCDGKYTIAVLMSNAANGDVILPSFIESQTMFYLSFFNYVVYITNYIVQFVFINKRLL